VRVWLQHLTIMAAMAAAQALEGSVDRVVVVVVDQQLD
jgi:hypothetical protein